MQVGSFKNPKYQPQGGPAMTGEVQSQWLIDSKMTPDMNFFLVKFGPGGRTVWHTHSFSQGLVVIDGEGIVSSEKHGERVVRAGDVVVCEAGDMHWHGASDVSSMTHICVNLPGSTEIHGPVTNDGAN